MTEREFSDTDDEEEDESKPKKRVPEWARGTNLESALHAQFGGVGGKRLDADEIFREVASCDLEVIFRAQKKRYRARGSSGNWLPDRLTQREREKYRIDLGFSPTAPSGGGGGGGGR